MRLNDLRSKLRQRNVNYKPHVIGSEILIRDLHTYQKIPLIDDNQRYNQYNKNKYTNLNKRQNETLQMNQNTTRNQPKKTTISSYHQGTAGGISLASPAPARAAGELP